MKKIIYSLTVLLFLGTAVNAGIVVPNTAEAVATNFYRQNTNKQVTAISLVYTELSAAGDPVYYAFNINGTEGFVLVSAEDAGRPIIGYSTEGNYVVPSKTSNTELNFWMQDRKTEIEAIRAQNIQQDLEAAREWSDYSTNKIHVPAAMSTVHPPLVQSKWNQSGGGIIPYNKFCPGGSVTGCVATTMAQIMRFWGYPAQGNSSHSYSAPTYGTLTANFAKPYNWAGMTLGSSNASVAQISYDCGVSVNMNYSPSESAAQVCGNPGAEFSYKTYFKYDPTLHCVNKSSYTTATWTALLEAELNAGRPVQYSGFDPNGGHTWVCDGNDANDKFHMNWGWGGSSDGYFDINSLIAGGFNFSSNNTALIGIKPLTPSIPVDAGIYTIDSPNGTTCNGNFTPFVTIRNFGSSTLTSCVITYNLDGGAPMTYTWVGSLASFQTDTLSLPALTAAPGTHTFTSVTSSPNGTTDGNTANDQLQSSINIITSASSTQAPYIEGFETSGFPYSDFYITNADATGPGWNTTTTVAATGHNSIQLDNFTQTSGDMDEFITPAIDLSTVASPALTFKLAHAQRNANDADVLLVYTSTNCGSTWTQRYSKASAVLANAGISATAFTPSSTQWRLETVNIANVAGQSSVRFKFQFVSLGAGNNIFIDDINIAGGNGVAEELATGFDLNVFPNPFTDNSTITFNTLDKYSVAVGLYDVVGKEVLSISNASQLNAGSYALPLNRSNLNAGIYFVKLTVDGYSVMKKVIVQ